MPVNAREAALRALEETRRRGARPESFLAHHGPEDPREMALAANITAGVLQNEIYLDYCIGQCTSTGRLKPVVRDILRLSAYQILYLDRVPDSAAVNEGVELAKRYAPWARGLVNAVLRRVAEHGHYDVSAGTEEERLSTEYSHPLWLVRRLIAEHGRDAAERMLAADNAVPPITVQVNTLKTTRGELAARLERAGAVVRPCPLLEDALELSGTGALERLPEFREGLFYVQDPAARLAAMCTGVRPGDRAIDLCAAPGGKSFAMAIAMGDRGEVLAYDIHGNKAGLISKGAERLGLGIIKTAAGDARVFLPELEGSADAVLADVPCSGFGVIRKKPEIRRKRPEELSELPGIQLEILKNAARYVKPGGRLVYSTCTVLDRENGGVIREFLGARTDFEPEPFTLPGSFGECPEGMRTILPGENDTDGFFICVLRKK